MNVLLNDYVDEQSQIKKNECGPFVFYDTIIFFNEVLVFKKNVISVTNDDDIIQLNFSWTIIKGKDIIIHIYPSFSQNYRHQFYSLVILFQTKSLKSLRIVIFVSSFVDKQLYFSRGRRGGGLLNQLYYFNGTHKTRNINAVIKNYTNLWFLHGMIAKLRYVNP